MHRIWESMWSWNSCLVPLIFRFILCKLRLFLRHPPSSQTLGLHDSYWLLIDSTKIDWPLHARLCMRHEGCNHEKLQPWSSRSFVPPKFPFSVNPKMVIPTLWWRIHLTLRGTVWRNIKMGAGRDGCRERPFPKPCCFVNKKEAVGYGTSLYRPKVTFY